MVQLAEEGEPSESFDVHGHDGDPAPRQERPLPLLPVELSVLHQDVPSLHHELRQTLHPSPLVARIVDVHVVGLGRDRPFVLRVEDHDVRVEPGGDRALPRIQAEHPGGRGRDDLDEAVEADPAVDARPGTAA